MLSQNLAPWLRRLETLLAFTALAPDPRRWRLIRAQQFLLHFARRQRTAPTPEHAAAFVADCVAAKTLRYPEQVQQAAALVLALLHRARTAFTEAIRREGRHDSQKARGKPRNAANANGVFADQGAPKPEFGREEKSRKKAAPNCPAR